jgi:hypothetical protein
MRIFYLQILEICARFIAWAGAGTFEISAVREITSKNTTSTSFEVCLWILVAATIITGIIDLFRFSKKITRYSMRGSNK